MLYSAIISLFAAHYNASLQSLTPYNLSQHALLDCVGYLETKLLDICNEALPPGSKYSTTNPDVITSNYLKVPNEKPLPRFLYFIKPFQQNVWCLLIICLICKIIILSFIHRMQHSSWNISLQILYAMLSILYQPFQLTQVKSPYRRFLEIIWTLIGFMVAILYLSALSSILFTRLYYRDINNFQDLVDHNITIMLDKFQFLLLNSSEIDPLVKQQLIVVPNSALIGNLQNFNPNYAYCTKYYKFDLYIHQQKYPTCHRMKVLNTAVNAVYEGIPMRNNWPFQHLLNDFYTRLLSTGICQRLYSNAIELGLRYAHLDYLNDHFSVEPLTIDYFQMTAIILVVGFSLACVAFLLELLIFKLSNKVYLST